MNSKEYARKFALTAYAGHLQHMDMLGMTGSILSPEQYCADLLDNAPLTAWFFAMNEWHPAQHEITQYNRIVALTKLGKVLTGDYAEPEGN